MSLNYKSAGVDIEAGYRSVDLIRGLVAETFRPETLSDIGSFGGMFSIAGAKSMEDPVLVSSTDGVGTKLKIAFLMERHDTVGIDCVAMCVNDLICSGAEPLFFLDYIACGKNHPEKIAEIVKGVAQGCKEANVSLIGGETAEMPGFYPADEYDLAGFSVGVLDRVHNLDGSAISDGDCVIGLYSNGLHSNGYSLVRKIIRPNEKNLLEYISNFNNTLGEELIKPTKIYVQPVLSLMKKIQIHGIANITGGGIIENIPRILPRGLCAKIHLNSWFVPPIFEMLRSRGEIQHQEMFATFNMGIGMVVVTSPEYSQECMKILSENGVESAVIGQIVRDNGVSVCFE